MCITGISLGHHLLQVRPARRQNVVAAVIEPGRCCLRPAAADAKRRGLAQLRAVDAPVQLPVRRAPAGEHGRRRRGREGARGRSGSRGAVHEALAPVGEGGGAGGAAQRRLAVTIKPLDEHIDVAAGLLLLLLLQGECLDVGPNEVRVIRLRRQEPVLAAHVELQLPRAERRLEHRPRGRRAGGIRGRGRHGCGGGVDLAELAFAVREEADPARAADLVLAEPGPVLGRVEP